MDMPSAWFDDYGALLYSSPGTAFEKLFGTTINEYQFGGINRPYQLDGRELEGFTIDMTPTSAEVTQRYDDGLPAITENKLGKGTAVILGYEASMHCFKPGNTVAEKHLLDQILNGMKPYFRCDEAIVYRLAADKADHYFLINDGEARSVFLDTDYSYTRLEDAISGEKLELGAPIELERYSGRWVRGVK